MIRLIDQSDIAEIEVKYASKHARFLLRKFKPQGDITFQAEAPVMQATPAIPEQHHYTVTAPLVGIFAPWSTTKEKLLVAIGDDIKQGQHIGVIKALDIPNEVEAPVAGRVVEILVHDGQRVEYGQPLVVIDQHILL